MNDTKRASYTLGVFDLLHIGHLKHFQRCKEYCDFLIVGVYTDEHSEFFKRKPIIPFDERIELVEALKPVDMAFKMEASDPVQKKEIMNGKIKSKVTLTIKKLVKDGWNIKYCFHDDRWTPEWKKWLTEDFESIGIKVIEIPYYKGRTTTGIINKIMRKEKELADSKIKKLENRLDIVTKKLQTLPILDAEIESNRADLFYTKVTEQEQIIEELNTTLNQTINGIKEMKNEYEKRIRELEKKEKKRNIEEVIDDLQQKVIIKILERFDFIVEDENAGILLKIKNFDQNPSI